MTRACIEPGCGLGATGCGRRCGPHQAALMRRGRAARRIDRMTSVTRALPASVVWETFGLRVQGVPPDGLVALTISVAPLGAERT